MNKIDIYLWKDQTEITALVSVGRASSGTAAKQPHYTIQYRIVACSTVQYNTEKYNEISYICVYLPLIHIDFTKETLKYFDI
jgi:hypothetical protein